MAIDNEQQQLLNLRDDAEHFKKTKLYEYLLKTSLEEATAASSDLLNINPSHTESIREIQNRAFLAYNMLSRVDEIITEGNNIAELLESEQNGE